QGAALLAQPVLESFLARNVEAFQEFARRQARPAVIPAARTARIDLDVAQGQAYVARVALIIQQRHAAAVQLAVQGAKLLPQAALRLFFAAAAPQPVPQPPARALAVVGHSQHRDQGHSLGARLDALAVGSRKSERA